MDSVQFLYPERIHAIWLVLGLVILFAFILIRRRDRLNRFMSPQMQARLLTKTSFARRVVQMICFVLCGLCCIFALMRPQIVTTETLQASKTTANLYVLLDVSKSMLATDVVPSRLERAKSEIRDMLPAFAAHHVGLMAFAGRSSVLSPLTVDQGFFRLVLDNAGPTSVTLGGTNIGDAIRKATKMLAPQEGPKAILLISDGEDHDSYPVDAAKEAKVAGIVIIAVGFGSETGSTIDVLDPVTKQKKRILDSSNKEVISKLDGAMMRDIALQTDGIYVPAGTGVLDLDGIIKKYILPLVEDVNEVRTREVRQELFQWLVALGIFFLICLMGLEGGGFRNKAASKGVEA